MRQRNHAQVNAIKNYAKALNVSFETAFERWIALGLAQRWAREN